MRKAIPLIRDMSLLSLTLFDELDRLDDVEFDYQRRGVLALYRSKEGMEEGHEEAHLLSSYGLEIRRVMHPKEWPVCCRDWS